MLAVALVSVRCAHSNAVARCADSSLCSLVLTNARPSKRNASGGTLKYHLDDSAHSEAADEHGALFGEEPLEDGQRDGPERCLWSSIPPPAAECACDGKQCACTLANSASTVSLNAALSWPVARRSDRALVLPAIAIANRPEALLNPIFSSSDGSAVAFR